MRALRIMAGVILAPVAIAAGIGIGILGLILVLWMEVTPE